MEKIVDVKQKKANKQQKIKKKEPLKVVYITNPMKFNVSASEFRGLVQELTGQDADMAGFAADDGGGEAAAAEDVGVHAIEEEEVVGKPSNDEMEQEGPDPLVFGPYDEVFFCPDQMIENFPGSVGSNIVDVFKSLDAMY